MSLRILLIDTDGVGLAFAWRCQLHGHKVRWFVKPKPCNNPKVGDGFKGIEKITNWVPSAMWADLIFVTSNDDYLPRLEAFKKRGAKYFGPSVASADLEIKRKSGMALLEKLGIDCPAYKTFKTLADAEQYVWKNEKRFVFKTLGDNEDKALSYCSKSPADMIARLRRWQDLKLNPKGEVMLQEFIPGNEMGVSRWMGREGWVGPPNQNREHKKVMSGNFGPNCGEQGTTMVYCDQDKLADNILAPLEKPLRELGHLGDLDINCIIDDKGKAWPLEFTSRPGWPAFNLMMAQHKGDPAQWMVDAMAGKDTLKVSYNMGLCVVVSQPDFPYGNLPKDETTGVPIYGITKDNSKFIQPQGVMIQKMPDMDGDKIVERDIWVTTGDYIAVVVALGPTVKIASKRCYATVDEIHVANMGIRDDIGEGMEKMLPEIQKFGYAKNVRYE